MKKRIKSLLVAVLLLAILVSGVLGSGVSKVTASADTVKLIEGTEFEVKPGELNHIDLKVVATDLFIYNPAITISAEKDAPFTFSNIKMHIGDIEVTTIGNSLPTILGFDVEVKDTAKIGDYPVTVKIKYYDAMSQQEFTTDILTKLVVDEEKTPAQLTVGNVRLKESNTGSNTEVSFTVKNEGEIMAKNVYLSLDFGEGIEERYTVKNIKIGDMPSGNTKDITLPISILPTAATGRRSVKANFTYKTSSGDEIKPTYNFNINLTEAVSEAKAPKLIIEDAVYKSSLQRGDKFTLNVKLKNIGSVEAKNISVAVDSSSITSTTFIKDYFMDGITVDDMTKGSKASANIPLIVSKYSTGGLLPVKLNVTYVDNAGTSYSMNETVYVDVAVQQDPETGKPNLIISSVTQKPAKPEAGEKVEISFYLENKSGIDATDLMVSVDGLTEATFIPVNADPYQYFEMLKGGDKVKVTIPLIISEKIPEGLNNISIKIDDKAGSSPAPVVIPVKNIQNETVSISKPKLIVSNYSTDVEELRAGSTFNLTFDVYNTNSSVAAKNITVTVTQPDNMFTVTQGSNSFFINKINPEESVSKTLEMKVKADATTKAYTVELLIEYEYDGLKPNPATGEIGEEKTLKINLQAIENSRPMVDNVNVYSWDGPVTMGAPATLHLDFYNMGRSPLNNIAVTVEGDFTKADGNMYFIGTTAQGSSAYADFDVIANVVGQAKGILKISYEDSNGDSREFTHEFTTDVMDAGSMPFPGDMGENPGDEVFNPGGVMPKKAIVPIWAFILIQCAIFVLFVPVTRKVIISIYKAKLLKKEQEKY